MKSPRRIAATILLIVAVPYLAVTAYMYVYQRDIMYNPGGDAAPVLAGEMPGVSVETIPMRDGTRVTVWRAEPTDDDLPTVLYFHGNSGNLTSREPRYKQILDAGYGLYAPTYRGYPGSEGSPTEAALIADALEHFDRLDENSDDIVLYGESLGSGVATAVATQRDAKAVILEAPFTATVDVAAERYPWLPVHMLMKDQFRSRDRISGVSEPVLILHGTADATTPYAQGKALYEMANDPKDMVTVEGAGHNDLWKNGLWDHVQSFLGQKAAPTS